MHASSWLGSEAMARDYDTVIGLEVHVELATQSKIFCGCSTAFGSAVNANTCPVCSGMPGTLPVLNKKVLEYATMVGLATNCRISRRTLFDRKNYFYPDNPQNYQISQLYAPLCRDGYILIDTSEGEKRIGIHEIHMEEDAGKLIHDTENNVSYVDYNRAGVPLIEIVSEPHMSNADEVIKYLEQLRMIIKYLGVSDCKLQEGSMRADVNISVRKKGCDTLGTRTELKNLNSFSAIRRAIEFESSRQIDIIESGNTVQMETRRWDDNEGCSISMRSKEDAKDYRYFPEPDLMPIVISDEYIEALRMKQPELREEKIKRYKEAYRLPDYDIMLITSSKTMADIFEETIAICNNPKEAANWLMVEAMRLAKEMQMDPDDISFSPKHLATLIELVINSTINRTVAKEVFEKIFKSDIEPTQYIKDNNLGMVDDTASLAKCIREVIDNNPQSVADYKAGKDRAKGFIVGQVMKRMKGKANPVKVNEMVETELNSN